MLASGIRARFNLFRDCKLSPARYILFRKVRPNTQLAYKRLNNLYELAETVERTGINGSFVECGVFKGGAAAVMAFVSYKAKSRRKIWLFDSFLGMPEPIEIDGGLARQCAKGKVSGRLAPIGMNVATVEDVNNLFFERFKFCREDIIIKKGWLQDTLPIWKERIGAISILRIDVDWYESTKCCLDNLYGNVAQGGYIIVDDYGYFPGCKIAVDEFINKINPRVNLIDIDREGVYFKKP